MTTPTSPLPVVYYAPPANPDGHGLYQSAALIDLPEGQPVRIIGTGVDLVPYNTDSGWGTWPSDPCHNPDDEDNLLKTGVRTQAGEPFEPLTVWGFDSCDPLEGETEITTRAAHTLRLHEQGMAEAHFGARLLTDAGTPTAVTDVLAAIGELEVEIGEGAVPGTIHLSRRWLPYLENANIIVGNGSPIPRTRLGTAFAFGAAYDGVLGNTMVATTGVTVWRSPVFTQAALDAPNNTLAAISERTLVIAYEAILGAVTVTP
ncbi:hypothetical protein [Rhodococcus sp. SJ-2]